MILVDALYINTGGTKTLLDYLVNELEKNNIDAFYIFDERCNHSYTFIDNSRKIYLKASLRNRYNFYTRNKVNFAKVFCVGNIPPTVRLKSKVYTYFHQTVYLNVPEEYSLIKRLKFRLKILFLERVKHNTDFWLVQSPLIGKELGTKYRLDFDKVIVAPFYPSISTGSNEVRKKGTYLYVSAAYPYKNHLRLIEAFCQFYTRFKTGELVLTVSEEFEEIYNLILRKKKEGFPITNLGYIGRNELIKVYQESEFLIFPSITESFGLGLIEGLESGCKVIAADLPYTFEVCDPSIVFNPYDKTSILNAFVKSLDNTIKPTEQRISNAINKLIDLLK